MFYYTAVQTTTITKTMTIFFPSRRRPVTPGAPDQWAYGLGKRLRARKREWLARAGERGRALCDACRKDVAPLCE